MNTTLIFLVIFFAILIAVFAFLAIFYLHIKNFAKFSPKILSAFRIFVIFIFLIAIFVIFKITTGKNAVFDESDFNISTNIRQDF